MTAITIARGPADWRDAELADQQDWRFRLSAGHRAELLAAAEAGGGFRLPAFGPALRQLGAGLLAGRGLCLVDGVPVAGQSERQCDLLSLGIARHVGRVMPQGRDGALLLHVRDAGADPAVATTRSYQHPGPLGFHADPHDIVALLCVRTARSGGLSKVISAVALHSEIVRNRPDLAEVLYQPWWRDRRTGDGPDSFYQAPVFAVTAGQFSANYGPDYIRSAQRGSGVPPLSTIQLEAMAVLDQLSEDPRFALTMDLQPGQMQFLSNHVTMHARTGYRDYPEPERRRDMIRIWLSA